MRSRSNPLRVALPGLLLGFSACEPAKTTGPKPQPLGNLVVGIGETHRSYTGQGEPIVRLHLATERVFPSISDYIDAKTTVRGRTISVRALRVIEPGLGLGAIGPARYSVTVPVTHGEYTIRIEAPLQRDEYRLIATSAALELRRVRTEFTRASPSLSWRYPRNSFALLCEIGTHSRAKGPARCDEFRAVMLAAVPLERIEFGEGEIPYPKGSTWPGWEWRAEYYRYGDDAAFAAVGEMVHAFGQRYPDNPVWAVNWRNEVHRSWIPTP
jgi:hypothetical protein